MSQVAADTISDSAASVLAKAREWQLALGSLSWIQAGVPGIGVKLMIV